MLLSEYSALRGKGGGDSSTISVYMEESVSRLNEKKTAFMASFTSQTYRKITV